MSYQVPPRALLTVLLLTGASPAAAQDPPARPPLIPADCAAGTVLVNGVHDLGTDFARVAELTGAFALRSWMRSVPHREWRVKRCAPDGATPWDARLHAGRLASAPAVEVLPIGSRLLYNSDYARGANDGAVWAGRGLSTVLHGGVRGELGPLRFALAPAVAWQQNRDFEYPREGNPALSPFASAGTIDLPYRHGPDPFATLDPGQSHLSVHGYGLGAGFSTENAWWGPGRRNSLLLTNSAPGVPRIFVGTDEPVDVRIGRLDVSLIWGRTTESPYFDNDATNDRNLLAGIFVALSPAALPGLSLGAARTYMGGWPEDGGTSLFELIRRPYLGVRDNPAEGDLIDNNILAFYARWAMPQSGFEAYVEWGREDGWADWLDIVAEPDHSQGYVVGFQKVLPRGTNWFRLAGELTHLHSAAPLRGGRSTGKWYHNASILQGHTHRGQLLGAGIGPGSDAQFLGADLFDGRGSSGIAIERIRYDEDRYYERWGRLYGMHGHDVEVTVTARRHFFWRDFDVSGEIDHSWRRNRLFLGLDQGDWNLRADRNL
jgi:hypothetical protein